MISNRIRNCDLSEEDKFNLNLILDSGDIEFVQNYLKEIEMKSTAAKNLPTMEICRLYEQGWSVKAIADKYDCTTSSIAQHLGKGGFIYDKQSQKWVKLKQVTMNVNSSSKKNRQRDVINWLLSGEWTKNTITVENVAVKFGCTTGQAATYLTGIAEKGMWGLKRIGRGVYQFDSTFLSNVAKTEPENKHSVPCIEPEVKDINIESFEAVLNFADNVGGLDNLVRIAQGLIKLKLK
jgi:hypothetical protein